MTRCMPKDAMELFLRTIDVSVSQFKGIFLTIHATAGDVTWLWDGTAFCMGISV